MYKNERDKTVDYLRGIAIFWVLVVHVLYWGNFFNNDYINLLKSFCLFEMPLFFFVTGASNTLSKSEDKYFAFVYKRFKRVLIPYWFFAVICASLTIIFPGPIKEINFIVVLKIFVSWLIPVDWQITAIPYLTWALWFIPVYLCTILIIPLLKKIKKSNNQVIVSTGFISLFVFSCLCKLGWIQNVIFYAIWTYIGLFYKELTLFFKKENSSKQIKLISIIGIILMVVLYIVGYSLDMQYNKFPPNLMFFSFSIMVMPIILNLIPYINKSFKYLEKNKVMAKILNLFSTRSMTIFLYQVFAFMIAIPLSNTIISQNGIIFSLIKSIICLILTTLFCLLFTIIFGNIENMKNRKRTS